MRLSTIPLSGSKHQRVEDMSYILILYGFHVGMVTLYRIQLARRASARLFPAAPGGDASLLCKGIRFHVHIRHMPS